MPQADTPSPDEPAGPLNSEAQAGGSFPQADREAIYQTHRRQFERYMANSRPLELLRTLFFTIKPSSTPPWIFIACMPKSGSTFISQKLASITGYSHARPISYYMDIEQNIDVRMVPRLLRKKIVCQMHTPGRLFNIDVMRHYGIRPVILIRDPRDVLLSSHDHFFRETPVGPMGSLDPDWFNWDFEQRLEYLIIHELPRIREWYELWWANKFRIDHLVVRYEELVRSPETKLDLFERILKFYKLEAFLPGLARLADDTDKELRRANVMQAGRWREGFSDFNLKNFDRVGGKLLDLLGYN